MSGLRRLPGDPPAKTLVERMIRVDHAGEYGAARIYAGQLAVLGRSATGPVIRRTRRWACPPPGGCGSGRRERDRTSRSHRRWCRQA